MCLKVPARLEHTRGQVDKVGIEYRHQQEKILLAAGNNGLYCVLLGTIDYYPSASPARPRLLSIMSDLYLSHLPQWLMRSPPAEWAIKQLRELVIGALSQGAVPQHIAFEMDGNRRYARSHKIETIEGHNLGFEALARVLEICYKCGVKVVTVYAFSIENYNRPKYEVDGLMQLAKVKLEQLMLHGEVLDRYGASVRVLGQRDLIRPDVLEVVDQIVESTEHNTDCIFNICFPYTSREEITTAIRTTVEEYSTTAPPHSTPFSETRITKKLLSQRHERSEGPTDTREASPCPSSPRSDDVEDSIASSTTLHPEAESPIPHAGSDLNRTIYKNAESITAETIDGHMYTAGCPPLDLFIRTSGVVRLSDFMLWQCHQDTSIVFLKCFWPEFDLWHFLPVLLEWQWQQKRKQRDEKPRRRLKQL